MTTITNEMVKVAVEWFETYAQTEKREVELLFCNISLQENLLIRQNLANIFSLDDDKWDMLDILDDIDVLENCIKIALRSINNDNNLESHIVKEMPSDGAKYAFLIVKRHLTLYAKIAQQKNMSFFKDSEYKDIYGFCKVFSVPNKLSVLLKTHLKIDDLKGWLYFDELTNKHYVECLEKCHGIKKFEDICLVINNEGDGFNKLIERVSEFLKDDKRLEFKIMHLRQSIRLFKRKWSFIRF